MGNAVHSERYHGEFSLFLAYLDRNSLKRVRRLGMEDVYGSPQQLKGRITANCFFTDKSNMETACHCQKHFTLADYFRNSAFIQSEEHNHEVEG